MNWLLTFVAVFALDVVWARYTIALTEDRPMRAGTNAAMVIALSGFATINYVNDPWMLLPAAGGAFAGTIVGMMKR
ncbi:hypothetical protein [Bradyrhizobium liaoningense]